MTTPTCFEDVLARLTNVRGSGTKRTADCPLPHKNPKGRLSVKDVGDKVLISCEGGNGHHYKQLCEAFGFESLTYGNNGPGEAPRRKIVEVYNYGPFEVVRTEPKDFYQRRPDGKGGYIYDMKGVNLCLYHEAEVKTAIADGVIVFVGEGEKDADRLRSQGLTATTNPMGAGKWLDSYSDTLTGADLVIIPDADKPGRDHVAKVAASCYGKAKRIRVLELTDGAKDASEWFDKGHTVDELRGLTDACPDYEPPEVNVSTPQIQHLGTLYKLDWPHYGLNAKLSQVEKKGLSIKGLLEVSRGESLLCQPGSIDVHSTRSCDQWKKEFDSLDSSVPWDSLITELATSVSRSFRAGTPTHFIDPDEVIPPQKFLVYPYLPMDDPSVFFCERGSGKSYLALLVAIIAALPWKENPYGILPLDNYTSVLYLDFESNVDVWKRRTRAICNGMKLPVPMNIYYKRCFARLVDMQEELLENVLQDHIGLVIVDSIGAAVQSDLNAPEPAYAFFSALRALGCTSLCIGHTSKDDGAGKKNFKKSVFGSYVYEAQPRRVWEVRHEQQIGSFEMTVGIHCRKSNDGPKLTPRGLHWNFFDEAGSKITVSPCDMDDIPKLTGQKTNKERITEFLTDEGSATAKVISDETGIALNTVCHALERGQGKWCRKLENEEWELL